MRIAVFVISSDNLAASSELHTTQITFTLIYLPSILASTEYQTRSIFEFAIMTSTGIVGSTGLVVRCTQHHPVLQKYSADNIYATGLAHPLNAPLAPHNHSNPFPYVQISLFPSSTNTPFLPVSRRAPSTTDPKLHPLTSTDNSTWSTQLTNASPTPSIFFSALGTTRAAAGSVEAQRAIDYDLNLALAKAAKEVGVKTYGTLSSLSCHHHLDHKLIIFSSQSSSPPAEQTPNPQWHTRK